MAKIMGVSEAIELIKSGDTVHVGGVQLIGYPEYIVKALEKKYIEKSEPAGLTLTCGCGHGVWDERGDSRFAHPGFLKRYIGTHPDTVPALRNMLEDGQVEAYIFPQGCMHQVFRAIAAKQPGILSKYGLGTYIDPRLEGGKCHPYPEDLIEVVELCGEQWLFYKAFPINVAIFRASIADEKGNISNELEGLDMEMIEVASAVKASGGKVIVQVQRIAKAGSLHPRKVKLPGVLVDAVVVCPNVEDHMMTAGTVYNPAFNGELKVPMSQTAKPSLELKPEDIIARRAVFEMRHGDVCNLGIGLPGTYLGAVAGQEGIINDLSLTLELGIFGGQPASWPDFSCSYNPECIIAPANMFDFYHAGGLTVCFLGCAEFDRYGNVNSSKFAGRFAGTGGFIDISQSTQRVVFLSTFSLKSQVEVNNGKVIIKKEGHSPKFVNKVEQVSFSGKYAVENKQDVIYITERGVFKLIDGELVLTEIAPGIDVEKDILMQLEFKPKVSNSLKLMDARIFEPGRMGIFE